MHSKKIQNRIQEIQEIILRWYLLVFETLRYHESKLFGRLTFGGIFALKAGNHSAGAEDTASVIILVTFLISSTIQGNNNLNFHQSSSSQFRLNSKRICRTILTRRRIVCVQRKSICCTIVLNLKKIFTTAMAFFIFFIKAHIVLHGSLNSNALPYHCIHYLGSDFRKLQSYPVQTEKIDKFLTERRQMISLSVNIQFCKEIETVEFSPRQSTS